MDLVMTFHSRLLDNRVFVHHSDRVDEDCITIFAELLAVAVTATGALLVMNLFVLRRVEVLCVLIGTGRMERLTQ